MTNTIPIDNAVVMMREELQRICDGCLDNSQSAAKWWTDITGFTAVADGQFVSLSATTEQVAAFLQLLVEETLQEAEPVCLAGLWQTLFDQQAEPVSGLLIARKEAHE